MSQSALWKTLPRYLAAVMLGLALGPGLGALAAQVWPAAGPPAPVQAAEIQAVAALDPASPTAVYTCTPTFTGTFINRVHVLCAAPAPGGIYYFAAATADSKFANRVLSIMLTAKSLGKNLQIYYDTSGDGSAYGCQTNDCRPINAIEMTN